MFKRLAKFRNAGLRHVAQASSDVMHGNDNLPGFRRPAATGRRRSATPALACHWFERDGRLECRWQAETNDRPAGDVDEHQHPTAGCGAGRSSMAWCRRGLALAG